MKRFLKRNGFTQKAIAEHLGMQPHLFGKKLLLKGNSQFKSLEIKAICAFTKIDECEFINEYFNQ